MTTRPILLAFTAFVVLAGANAAAVKVVLGEMPPFWSAGLRFVVAGALLLAFMVIQRRPAPRGQQLLGTVLFGVIAFALAYFFLYQAIGDAGSGTTMTVLAIVPLLTVLLSVVHGIERPRLLGVVGALIAAAGIVIVAAAQVSLSVPLIAIALLLVAAIFQAESVVIVKRLPPGDPVAANALGMLLGGSLLVAVSLVAGEPLTLPTKVETLLGMAYLIGPGSIGVFMLALFVLARWTASATSYAFLLFPLVAIVLGAVLFAEPVQPSFLLGGAVVLAGVYVGAIYRPKARAEEREPDANQRRREVKPGAAAATGRRSPRRSRSPRQGRPPPARAAPCPSASTAPCGPGPRGSRGRAASPRRRGSCPGCRRCRRSSSPGSSPSSSKTGAEDRLDPAGTAHQSALSGCRRARRSGRR